MEATPWPALVVRSENNSQRYRSNRDTPRKSPEGAPLPTSSPKHEGSQREEAPLVSPVGRPPAPAKRLRRAQLGYRDFCRFCHHSYPFHQRENGACRLKGCNCPAFKTPRPTAGET